MTLAGQRVLITRPAAQARALCALIEQQGGATLPLPLLEIAPVSDPGLVRNLLAEAAHYDFALFTSVNAVDYALQLAPNTRWPRRIGCIGAATAQAVTAAGLPAPLTPAQDYSSEGLLALAELHNLEDTRVLLVTGVGGRETLADTLRARGAHVVRAEVYRRTPATVREAELRAALAHADCAVVTSGETLERLLAVTPAGLRARLLQLPLVVPSQRVLQMARAHGFTAAIGVPQPMSDAGLLRALMELANSRAHTDP